MELVVLSSSNDTAKSW